MSRFLLTRPEADADIDEAYRWHEERRKGLGDDFLLCLEETLARIGANPLAFPVVHRDVRRAAVRRFPCGAFFRPLEDRIVILGVFHARRDPRRWQRRT